MTTTTDTDKNCEKRAALLDLFNARTIALVGATDRSRWSSQTFANLRKYSPGVTIHCVAPKGGIVHGQRAFTSLGDIGEPVELVYVMSPRETVEGIIYEAAAAGVKIVVVLTAGFGEVADGRSLEASIINAAEATGVALLGPNVSGYINVLESVIPFGLSLASLPDPGAASYVLQSGGLVKPLLSLADAWASGVGVVACTGNEASLTIDQVASTLLEDNRTGAVGLFLETVRDPIGFRKLAARATELDKPIVALTVGSSGVGQRAALAHTGALAGDASVMSAVLRSLGIIEVTSLEELVATTDLLARGVRPAGNRVAVVGASGGACEIIADKAAKLDIELPDFSAECTRALEKLLPNISHAQNPLDVTGMATVDPLLPVRATDKIVQYGHDGVDAILFEAFVLPTAELEDTKSAEEYFDAIAESVAKSPLPVLLQDEVAAPVAKSARRILHQNNLVRLPGIEIGLTAYAHAVEWFKHRQAALVKPDHCGTAGSFLDFTPGEPMSEMATLRLLASGGVPVIEQQIGRTGDEAVAIAASLGEPVALKVCSPDILHKSDVGGVVLSRQGEEEVRSAFEAIMKDVSSAVPEARIDGILISPMRMGGVELIVGIKRDPVWGPIIIVGIGGIWVEILQDIAIRPLPLGRKDVRAMLQELRSKPLLSGVRGEQGVDVEKVVDAVLAIASVAEELGDSYVSIEINPLRADHHSAEALDGVIEWADNTSEIHD